LETEKAGPYRTLVGPVGGQRKKGTTIAEPVAPAKPEKTNKKKKKKKKKKYKRSKTQNSPRKGRIKPRWSLKSIILLSKH